MKPALVATIICPHCHAELEAQRETCPYCHNSVLVQPPPIESTQSILNRPWMIAILLLHVGFLGIPLFWRTDYSRSTRILICVASVVYTVAAVAIIYVVGRFLVLTLTGG